MELERETEIILPAMVKLYASRTIDPDEVIRVKREEFRKAPRELVRCKDCAEQKDCEIAWILADPEGFCNMGKRKGAE